MKYQKETIDEYRKLKEGTVAQRSHMMGLENNEPLIVAMDAMLRYAKAVRRAYGSTIADDGVLGGYYIDAINGLRGLLDGMGAIAMENDITTDTKDNGCIESIFFKCLEFGGFDDEG